MIRELWTPEELADATAGRIEGDPDPVFGGVSIDSRTLRQGDIFVAIKGERLDGHDYTEAALAAGAGVAVVSKPSDDMRKAGALLVVSDTLRALENMGRAARARTDAKIVAVTGSVGKTSTKEALRLALAPSGLTHASAASFNNHWGVPLTLARMPKETQFGVFEIGMNNPGEITPLTQMVKPHVAIITAIAESHLGHFDSLEGIADAKAEIFVGLEAGGVAVINRDTPYFDRLSDAAKAAGAAHIYGFGKHDAADVRLKRLVLHADCSCVTADILGEDVTFKLGVPGEHMAQNALAVLAACKLVGGDLAEAALALAGLAPAKGRGVRLTLGEPGLSVLVIDESYNANPASMRAALALLGQAKSDGAGRLVAVLGDMLELGGDADLLHAGLAEPIEQLGIDVVHACGPHMSALWESLPTDRRGAYAATSQDLIEQVVCDLRDGDVLMIKGSLGSRMAPVVEAIKSTLGDGN